MENSRAKVIAITLQKGGVGKTMFSVNIAAYLSTLGYKVLLIDMDAHCSATKYLGAHDDMADSIYEVLKGSVPLKDIISTHTYKYGKLGDFSIDLAPSNLSLNNLEDRKNEIEYCEYRLNLAVETVIEDYDYIIIDSPPETNVLLTNVFNCTDYYVLPVLPDASTYEELAPTISQIQDLSKIETPGTILGCVINQRSNRPIKYEGVERHPRELFGDTFTLFDADIPTSFNLKDTVALRTPLPFYHLNTKRCDCVHFAFRKLTLEILERIRIAEERE